MNQTALQRKLGVVVMCAVFFSLAFGCGGSDSTTTTTTGGMGLGPSGLTCINSPACFSPPAAGSMSCPASVGPNVAVMASDYDYVLNKLNAIRTGLGLGTLVRTAALDAFANAASLDLMGGGGPHAYFTANAGGSGLFPLGGAENQTAPSWTTNTTTTQIDEIVACFMSEEDDPPGFQKGHWEAIVCPCFTMIGVGLVKGAGGELFLTIDFSQ